MSIRLTCEICGSGFSYCQYRCPRCGWIFKGYSEAIRRNNPPRPPIDFGHFTDEERIRENHRKQAEILNRNRS